MLDSKLQKKRYRPEVCWKKVNTANNTTRHDYKHVKQIFVDLCGTRLSMQVNMKTATARELVGLALQRKGIRYTDVYLLYSGKIIDGASRLGLLHVPKDACFAIVPRCRAGQDNLMIFPTSFADFVKDMKPFYRVVLPEILRHANAIGNPSIVFLSQSARCLVHMMIVFLSRLHADNKSLSGKFNVTDFLFWNGCALIRRGNWDDATTVNVILDFRRLSQIIDWLFRRPGLQPPVLQGSAYEQLPAYVADLVSFLRVFVYQGDNSALRAYASNHPALLSFRDRIRKILELEVFYNFLDHDEKKIFRKAIGTFGRWDDLLAAVGPIYDAYIFGSSSYMPKSSDDGVDYIIVSRNFLSHPNEQQRGGSKRSTVPVGFTEEQAEAALTLYCPHLPKFLLMTVTRYELKEGVDQKLICGNEVADAEARGGESSGSDFSA